MLLRRNRLAAFVAMLAMALQVFWPLLAQARPRIAGQLVPVCTVDGVTHYLELPAGKSPLDERSASHGEHCKLCVFGGDRDVAVEPRDAVVFVVSNSGDSRVVLHPASFQEPANHPPAQPRAPPSVS